MLFITAAPMHCKGNTSQNMRSHAKIHYFWRQKCIRNIVRKLIFPWETRRFLEPHLKIGIHIRTHLKLSQCNAHAVYSLPKIC